MFKPEYYIGQQVAVNGKEEGEGRVGMIVTAKQKITMWFYGIDFGGGETPAEYGETAIELVLVDGKWLTRQEYKELS